MFTSVSKLGLSALVFLFSLSGSTIILGSFLREIVGEWGVLAAAMFSGTLAISACAVLGMFRRMNTASLSMLFDMALLFFLGGALMCFVKAWTFPFLFCAVGYYRLRYPDLFRKNILP